MRIKRKKIIENSYSYLNIFYILSFVVISACFFAFVYFQYLNFINMKHEMYQQLSLFSQTHLETINQIQGMQELSKSFSKSQLDSLSKINELNNQINNLNNQINSLTSFINHQQEQSLLARNQILNQFSNLPRTTNPNNTFINTVYSMGAGVILNYAFSFVVKNSLSNLADHFNVMSHLPYWVRKMFIEKREIEFGATILDKSCVAKLKIEGDEVVSFLVKDSIGSTKYEALDVFIRRNYINMPLSEKDVQTAVNLITNF